MVLGECRRNYRQAANTYAERYPNRERKSYMVFKRLECFIAYDTMKEKKEHKEKTATYDENAVNILAAFQLNSTISTR